MIRATLIMLAIWVPLIAAGEWGARQWIAAHGDALDITRSVLKADPEIGWRQRADLRMTFLGKPLETDGRGWRVVPGAGGGPTVLVLGPSSAFGWGVANDETYAAQLQALLAASSSANVINAGEIGYSVVQGARLFEEALESGIRPRVVVIAYGVNDVDLHRFFYDSPRSDAEEFREAHSALGARLTTTLLSSALVDVGFKALGVLGAHLAPAQPDARKTVRVPEEEFRASLAAFIARAKENGADVVLLTTIVLPPPDMDAAAEASMRRVQDETAKYSEIVRAVGREASAHVADLDALFPRGDRSALFADPIHFSKDGNALVAEALRSIITDNHLLEHGN